MFHFCPPAPKVFRKSFVFRLRDWVGSNLYVYRFSVAIHFDLFNSLAPVVIRKAPGCVCFRFRRHPARDRENTISYRQVRLLPEASSKDWKITILLLFPLLQRPENTHWEPASECVWKMITRCENPKVQVENEIITISEDRVERRIFFFSCLLLKFFCGHDIPLNQSWLRMERALSYVSMRTSQQALIQLWSSEINSP